MKTITPERDGRRTEYRAELDGELIGYFKTWTLADDELNRLIFERARRGNEG